MTDVTKGTNFYILPKVDLQSATKAEAQMQRLVEKAVKAVEQGNDKVLANLNAKVAKEIGAKDPEVTVKVSYETNSATGQLKEVKKLSASALDPMIKDYQKMVQVQGEAAISLKRDLAVQRDKLTLLKQQASIVAKNGRSYKKNLKTQKETTAEIKKLEGMLTKVSTLSSLKGQLRAESQRLSMMSQYNLGLDKQGERTAVINKEYVRQVQLVKSLTSQVNVAGAAAKGFGAKLKAAGMGAQAAFGWISAVAAGLAALAGTVGILTGRVKDIQSLKLTFEGLGRSAEAQNDILAKSRNIALGYGVSLRKVEGAFRRLGPAILESGGTLNDTAGAIESISARTTMLGLNTEQAGRYIEAFAQVMGKGKLQGEELNQQFAELDGGLRGQLKNWLAANKGITDFEGAMKRGEITSGLFLEAFQAINEEIRNKFLRSIGDTQKGIENMGKQGGMTLNQLNAKLMTLTSIGIESVGKALAPLGKELMKIYAAFVQVFTKIATEMPGLQALFQGLGHVIGVVLKVTVNTALLLLGVIAKVVDGIVRLFQMIGNLPGFKERNKALADMAKALNANFDSGVDGFSKLSDATIGATSDLKKYNDELDNLETKFIRGQVTQEEYEKKRTEILNRRVEAEKQAADKQLEIEMETMNKMLEARRQDLERAKQLADRKIEKIEEVKDKELAAIDETIEGLKKQKREAGKVYDDKIDSVKRAAELEDRAIVDQIDALRRQKQVVRDFYDQRMEAVKSYYDRLKSEMNAAHDREMSQIDDKIAKLRSKQAAEMGALDSGPQQELLNTMKLSQLRKELRSESDRYRKQEIRAQIEQMENSKRRAALEIQQQAELKAAQEEKARLEKKQAEEKKRLDEEEKARVKALKEEERVRMEEIKNALQVLAGIKKQNDRDEKDSIRSLKEAREEAMDEYDDRLELEKKKRQEVTDDHLKQIALVKKKLKDQERVVEDIESATKDVARAQANDVASAVDRVTNGALERQLQKVLQIKREAAKIKTGGGGSPAGDSSGFRASGGPVAGGAKYTVNELGREGFMSASGKLSEIKAPAWGSWRAPSSGTVIPAHIWKNVKANQKAEVKMPSNINPGNGVASVIRTISSTSGDTISNNVTVQAVNPAQTANNMLVQLTKVRRRRMGL